MAQARKCDICGKLYEFYEDTTNYIELYKIDIYGRYSNNDKDKYDICRPCGNAILTTISKLKESEVV